MKRVLAQSMFQQMPGLHLQLLMYQMSAANPTGMPKTVFKGYTQRIDSLCFSPNNLLIATACLNGTIHLWDILNARLIRKSLTGQTAKISSLCFSPDSSQLVCGSEDRLIRIWDVATYTQLEEPLKGHLQAVRHLCFSPNATYLASSSDDKTILIWNFATRRIHASYSTNSENAITCLCFNPNSNQIAIGFNDGGILLWYFNQDFPHKLPTPNKEAITSLCYNAQGTQLVASSDNFTVHIWDTNKHTHATKRLPYAYLENAQFVSNNTALITTSLHDLINIWNVSNPAKPFMILPNFCTHTEGQLSPDCRYVAATYGYPRRDTIILTQLTDVDLDKWLSQTIKPEQIAALSYIMNRITQLKSINLEKYFSLLKIPLHEKLEIFLMNATAEQNRKQPSHDWVSGDGLRD